MKAGRSSRPASRGQLVSSPHPTPHTGPEDVGGGKRGEGGAELLRAQAACRPSHPFVPSLLGRPAKSSLPPGAEDTARGFSHAPRPVGADPPPGRSPLNLRTVASASATSAETSRGPAWTHLGPPAGRGHPLGQNFHRLHSSLCWPDPLPAAHPRRLRAQQGRHSGAQRVRGARGGASWKGRGRAAPSRGPRA